MTLRRSALARDVEEEDSREWMAQSRSRKGKEMSSPDIVFREILRGLYEGRFVPGQRLIEADLTREFKVSRGSVREALSRLAAEGVVSSTRHRGAYIRSLTRDEVKEILRVLEIMVGLAASLAAARIGLADNRKRFKASFEHMAGFERNTNYFEFVRARNRFHRTLFEIGGNRELSRLLPRMHVHLIRIQFRAFRMIAERVRFTDYRQIAEAVLAGEPKLAERRARQHIQQLYRSIEKLPDSAFASTESHARGAARS